MPEIAFVLSTVSVLGTKTPRRCGAQVSRAAFRRLLSHILRRSTTSHSNPRAHPDQHSAMGKVPVRLKEVVYTLSPYHQHVMAGLWKDVPYKLSKKFHENWVSAFTLVVPIVGTYMYAENFREKEKLHHRY